MQKYTVVIPTMWKYPPFEQFLHDLNETPEVGEIILIDNDVRVRRINKPDETYDKVRWLIQEVNIGVNPAWNLGVAEAKNDLICIVNDDIVFDTKIFRLIDQMLQNPKVGLIGLNPGRPEFFQTPVTSGVIKLEKFERHNTFGFGCLFFVNKKNWIPIPAELKIYFGDNWAFETALITDKENWLISDMLFCTPYAQTTKTIDGADSLLEKERDAYEDALYYFHEKRHSTAVLQNEYEMACNTPSDINLHLPMLKKFADRCEVVVEFGTRTGVSTRALLNSNARTVIAYDLALDPTVEELFRHARVIGKWAVYAKGDSRLVKLGEPDMLFIDTDHTYEQLSAELNIHGNTVQRYIAFHDTETYGQALLPAVIEFLYKNTQWAIAYISRENNGFLVIERLTK